MITAVTLNSIMQFAFMICLMFTLGDLDKVENSPTGLPIIEVYYQATKSKQGTNILVVMIALILFISLFNIFASVSRLTWAFARDKGLPFSSLFSYVSTTCPSMAAIQRLTEFCATDSSKAGNPAERTQFSGRDLRPPGHHQHRFHDRLQRIGLSPADRPLHLILHSDPVHPHSKASRPTPKVWSIQAWPLGDPNQLIRRHLRPLRP